MKWEEWAKTLRVGVLNFDFHPGSFEIGSGIAARLFRYNTVPRLLEEDCCVLGQYNPQVGEGYSIKSDEDGDYYVEFKLKPGMTFNDGTPMTAQNVKYCWYRAIYEGPEREQNYFSHTYCHKQSWARSEKKLVVEDDLTLRMYVDNRWPYFDPEWKHFLFGIHFGFTFSDVLAEQYAQEESSLADHEIFAKQGGYGPFVLESWVPNERYTMVADENYPVNPLGGGAGPSYSEHIKKVIVIRYDDSASLRMALEAGDIDITTSGELAKADIPDLWETPGITVEYIPHMGYGNHLHMNFLPEFYPLNVTEVRQAIQYMVDPQEIIDTMSFGTADISHTPVRPAHIHKYWKPVLEPIRSMPEEERIAKAKELLAAAGFPDGFTTQFWYASGVGSESFNRDLGTILQAQLAKADINIELKYIESGVYYDMRNQGQIPMFLRGWTFDYADPDTELWYYMHSDGYIAPKIGFNNSHVDALLEEGRVLYASEEDVYGGRREEVYNELQDFIVDAGFSVPLYKDGFYYAYGDHVKNYIPWQFTDACNKGIWNIEKVIPDDWETQDPPF
jgi:ABC-type transport system substrate-binding protein